MSDLEPYSRKGKLLLFEESYPKLNRHSDPLSKTIQEKQGVTLIELVIVVAILAIALTAVTQLLSRTNVRGAYTYNETMAIELGQSYIAEITSKRYDENSPIGGVPPCGATSAASCTTSLGLDESESRATYDDVDDYNGLTDDPPMRPNSLGGVEARPGYDNFRVDVSVNQASSFAKKITVSVTQPNDETIDFTVYKTNF